MYSMMEEAQRVIDLPVFTTRMDPELRVRLRAAAEVTGEPMYKLVARAVDLLLDKDLNTADRRLVDELAKRKMKG